MAALTIPIQVKTATASGQTPTSLLQGELGLDQWLGRLWWADNNGNKQFIGMPGLVSSAALTAALATVAQQADLARLNQNVLYQGLLEASLRGVPQGLVDGVIDPYSTTADINASKSSGYTFSSSAGTIGATPGSQTAAPNGTASAIDVSGSNVAANAFDGNTSTYWQSATLRANGPWIQQKFGSAYSVTGFTISHQVANGASGKVRLQYSDDGSSFSSVGDYALAQQTAAQTISTPNSAGSHIYWRLLNIDGDNTNSSWTVTELVFMIPGPPQAMTLQSATLPSAIASPSAARVLVQVDSSSAAFTPNTDLVASFSRDGGTTFTQGALSAAGAMPDGTTLYDTGYFSVSGQPPGNSSMTYQLTTPSKKAIVLTGVSMQVRS